MSAAILRQPPLPIDWRDVEQGRPVLVGEANRAALSFVERPDLWPSHCALLVGPPRSGRSTIAHALAGTGMADVIDDADGLDEAELFHAWNRTREAGVRLLLVARAAPPVWQIALPDLASRLATAGVARIGAPDEALTEALIADGLATIGAPFSADLPRWLARRLPRSYVAVDRIIALLNRAALGTGKRITPALAAPWLDGLDEGDDDGSSDND